MVASSLLGYFFCFLFAFEAVAATYTFVYEFGSSKGGYHVYEKDGRIGLLQYTTNVKLLVPKVNSRISYVKVIVHAISKPRVEFNEESNIVTIRYGWAQLTISSYKIFAKAVPTLEPDEVML